MPRRLLIAALVLGLLLPAAGAHAATPGLNIDFSPTAAPKYIANQLDLARKAHLQQVRVEVDWNALEPTAAGVQDPAYVALLDSLMAKAARRHLKVIATVIGSPCWATTAPADRKGTCAPATSAAWATYPPADPADYAEAAAFVARRWKKGLAALEVWNEPDHENQRYFRGPDKPQRYTALVKAAYPAVKRVAPNVAVLAGSLVGANGNFLKALYQQGIRGSYDGLAVHYYDLVLASLRSIRAVQRANHDSKPIWLTEFGWTTCWPAQPTQGGHDCIEPATQGQDLVDTLRALRTTSWVKAATIYTIQDSTQYSFGLLDKAGKAKPALADLTKALGRRLGSPTGVKLTLRRSGSRIVARGSGPAGDALELDAYKRGRLAYKASFQLDRFNRFTLKLPPQLGVHDLRVRVFQYWSGVSATKRMT